MGDGKYWVAVIERTANPHFINHPGPVDGVNLCFSQLAPSIYRTVLKWAQPEPFVSRHLIYGVFYALFACQQQSEENNLALWLVDN